MKQPRRISNTQLTAFKRSPQHWLHYINEPKKQTEAMVIGQAAHCLALQKEKFKDEFFLMDLTMRPKPDKNFQTKVNQIWRDEQIELAGTKPVLTTDDLPRLERMVSALYEDVVARDFLKAGSEFEVEMFWECLGLGFVGRKDISSDEFIVDLKFVNNANPQTFQRTLFKDGIYRQGGMYLDGEMKGEYTGDPHKRVIFIAVESVEPHGVSVHEMNPELIQIGVSEYRMLAQQLKVCLDEDYFPSYHHRSIHGHFEIFTPSFIDTE